MTTETLDSKPVRQPASKKSKKDQPKGWIRWSGLGIFLAIIGAIFAITYLSLTLLLKGQLEKVASDAWGAKIDIGSLDIGLLPIRVGLKGLQVTDPDKPMTNMVEVDYMGASLNFYHLVVGRTVIENLSVEGLAFDQPRSHSGALPNKAQTEKTADTSVTKKDKDDGMNLEVPKIAIPDPSELLTRANLKSLQKAEEIEKEIAAIEAEWKALEQQIPSDQELKSYEKRFTDLTKGKIENLDDITAKQQELEQLQKELEGKHKAYQQAEKLMARLPKLQKQVLALRKLPEQDLARLQQTYSLDGQGFSNLTYLLYGPKIQSYLDKGRAWYEKAQPFIERLKQHMAEAKSQAKELDQTPERQMGTDVAFTEYDPQPELMIKRVHISGDIEWGALLIEVNRLNFDQPQSKIPVQFSAKLQPQGQQSGLQVIGESNFINPEKGFHTADFSWSGYDIQDWALLEDDSMPILMKKATTDVVGKVLIVNHQQLDGSAELIYKNVDFDVSQSKSKDVQRYIKPIFDDIHQFTVESDFKGDLFAPSVGAKSDLDKKLSGAFNKLLYKEVAKAKADLKKELDKLVAAEIAPIEKELADLLGDQVKLDKNASAVDQIMSLDAEKLAKQQQQKYQRQLENEANKRIDAEKKKLEAARKKQEEAAKKKLEAEKNKLEKELMKSFGF